MSFLFFHENYCYPLKEVDQQEVSLFPNAELLYDHTVTMTFIFILSGVKLEEATKDSGEFQEVHTLLKDWLISVKMGHRCITPGFEICLNNTCETPQLET
jgi:hypothetical protein